jgi:SAM-dependent methyltransferase
MTAGRPQCPICLSANVTDITGTLHECRSCGVAFNSAYNQKLYNDSYFLDEYKNQYGRTYLDDYQSIYAISKTRLKKIVKHYHQKKYLSDLSLLDIGSAAGFFLKCAVDTGIQNVTGIEISEYASRYCREQFHIPVINSSFQDARPDSGYDVITAWFFIEHCKDPIPVIQKIYGLLKEGGVFAFSCPSIFGPLFILNMPEWARTHPEDHRIDCTPRGARTILKKCGFKKIYIYPSGIHPERVISPESIFYRAFSPVYTLFSRMTSFSDTIEVYAVK